MTRPQFSKPLRRFLLESLESRRMLTKLDGVDDFVDAPGDEVCFLAAGETVSGLNESTTDLDVFAVDAIAGEVFAFEFRNTGHWSRLRIFGADEQVVFQGENASDSKTAWKALTTGPLYFGVDTPRNNSNRYQLRVEKDDHPNQASRSVLSDIESVQQGVIGYEEDVDWFRFATTPGNAYSVQAAPLHGGNLDLLIRDGQQNTLARDENGYSGQAIVASPTSEIFVGVSSRDAFFQGDYQLNVVEYAPSVFTVEPMAGDDELELGAPNSVVPIRAAGEISEAQQSDKYRFRAVPGSHVYRFETRLGSLVNTTLELRESGSLEILAEDNESGEGLASLIYWRPQTAGVYELDVRALAGLGSYEVLASVVPDDASDVIDGSASTIVDNRIDGLLGHIGDVDVFRFEADKDANYWLSYAASGSVVAQVLAGDGETVVTTIGQGRAVWKPAESGTYYVRVNAFSDNLRRYAIHINELFDDHVNTIAEAPVSISFGTTAGRLETTSDVDVFAFAPPEGTLVRFNRVFTNDVAVTPELVDSLGNRKGLFNDDSWLAEGGQHYLRVNANNVFGEYEFEIESIADDHGSLENPTRIEVGENVVAQHEAQADTDAFVIKGIAGKGYELESTSAVTLRDASGETVGRTRQNRLTWKADGSDYTVLAENRSGQSEYQIDIREVADDNPDDLASNLAPLQSRTPIAGVLEVVNDVDAFVFDANAGDDVEIISEPNGVALYRVVSLDSEIEYLPSASGATAWVAPETGRYGILVTQTAGIPRLDYTLRVTTDDDFPDSPGDPDAIALQEDVAQRGELEMAADVDVFAFNVQEDDDVQIDAVTTGADSALLRIRIWDQNSVELATELDRLNWKATKTATYYVTIEDHWQRNRYPYEVRLVSSDDQLDVPSPQASPLAVGDVLPARFETINDVDVLAISTAAQQVIRFDITGDVFEDNARIRLFDSNEQTVVVETDLTSFQWKSPSADTFYFELQTTDGAFGEYQIETVQRDVADDHVDQPLDGMTPLAQDTVVGARHEVWNDRDLFAFDAVPRESFSFSVSLVTLPQYPSLRVLDSLGNSVQDPAVGPNYYWEAETAGRYYLEVNSPQHIGSYNVSMSSLVDDFADRLDEALPIERSETAVQGVFEIPGDVDVWSFVAAEEEAFTIRSTASISIRSADGKILASSSGEIGWEPDTPGTYFVSTFGGSNNQRNYSLWFDSVFDDYGDKVALATEITVGTIVRGQREINTDVDVFFMNAEAKGIYRVQVTGASLERLSATGPWIPASDWQASEAGRQYLRIVGGGVGAYTLRVIQVEDDHADTIEDQPVTLQLDTPLAGESHFVGDPDVFAITAELGQAFNLQVQPAQSIRVLTSTGEDLSGCTICREWQWKSRESGEQFIRVTGSLSEYQLTLSSVEAVDDHADFPNAETSLLVRDVPIAGEVEFGDEWDVFAFDVEVGDALEFSLVANSTGHRIAFFDTNGQITETFDTNSPVLKVPSSGRYYVGLTLDSLATYELSYSVLSPDDHADVVTDSAVVLLPNQPLLAEFERDADRDVFAFDVEENQAVHVRVDRGAAASAAIQLLDSDGITPLLNTQVDELSWTSAAAGRYYLAIDDLDSGVGEYEVGLSISDDDHQDQPSSTATKLTVAGVLSGQLEVGNDVDVFAIDAVAGVEYVVSIQRDSPVSNSTLAVLDENGEELTSKFGASITWTAPKTGRHFVSVTGSRPVGYVLSLTSNTTANGDLNGDGRFDSLDIDALFAAVRNNDSNLAYDINGDGAVDESDVALFQSQFNIVSGDANLDGQVGFEDFLMLSSNFGNAGGWAEGNFDGNELIDFADFLLLSSRFGR